MDGMCGFRGPLEELWSQVGNLFFFFMASVNAHKWMTSKLTYRMVGCHGRKDARIALPKPVSLHALTSRR